MRLVPHFERSIVDSRYKDKGSKGLGRVQSGFHGGLQQMRSKAAVLIGLGHKEVFQLDDWTPGDPRDNTYRDKHALVEEAQRQLGHTHFPRLEKV